MNRRELEQREKAGINAICPVCGGYIHRYGRPQYAHKIANTVANRRKWGSFIIDHPLNGVYVCSMKCNDACNIGFNPGAVLDLIAEIVNHERQSRE